MRKFFFSHNGLARINLAPVVTESDNIGGSAVRDYMATKDSNMRHRYIRGGINGGVTKTTVKQLQINKCITSNNE